MYTDGRPGFGDTAMKRSIGVTVSAVVTIVGSVFTALFGVLMLAPFAMSQSDSPEAPPMPGSPAS